MIWFFLLELGNLIFGWENQAWYSILFSSSVFFPSFLLHLQNLCEMPTRQIDCFLQIGYLLFRWSSSRSCSAAKNQRPCYRFVGSTPGRLVIEKQIGHKSQGDACPPFLHAALLLATCSFFFMLTEKVSTVIQAIVSLL